MTSRVTDKLLLQWMAPDSSPNFYSLLLHQLRTAIVIQPASNFPSALLLVYDILSVMALESGYTDEVNSGVGGPGKTLEDGSPQGFSVSHTQCVCWKRIWLGSLASCVPPAPSATDGAPGPFAMPSLWTMSRINLSSCNLLLSTYFFSLWCKI